MTGALHAQGPAQGSAPTARLATAVAAYQKKDYATAIAQLSRLETRLPKLADYIAYYRVAAEVESQAPADVLSDLAPVWSAPVASPLESRAALAGGAGLVAAGKPTDAVKLLAQHYEALAQPDGDLALAIAYDAAGDSGQASIFYQQAYYRYPASDAAAKAALALPGLIQKLGAQFPTLATQQMLLRADRLLEARDLVRAKAEYQNLIPQLTGIEREQALVRVGAADFLRGDYPAAAQYLKSLPATDSEANAERLYFLEECARKQNDEVSMMDAIRALDRQHEHSPWRLQALLAAGNRFLVANRPDDYEPLFRAASRSFPDDPRAASASWKYVWAGYIRRQSDAADRLREHLKSFPTHSTAASALYFLGRLAEDKGDLSAARAYYQKLADTYANYYYGLLGRRKLSDAPIASAPPSTNTNEFLNGILWPQSRYTGTMDPSPETSTRIERAHLLRSAGLNDLADLELRYGARHSAQPVLLAIDMARSADSAFLGLRAMKSLVPDSLAMPMDAAPKDFWQLLFPLPYKDHLLSNAKSQGLDPSMIAALVRQESEFNPQALSRAKAYGLAQVMPSTGRSLARKAGMRTFSTRMLYQPETNLRLGSLYLRMLLDQLGGNWEETLAAYNAGKSRVIDWQKLATYREPAEFVESIPFTETREYVQAVLRNAELYRKIWNIP